MEKTLPDLAALEAEAAALAKRLAPKETATLVTLSGELGAGKTAFAKALAKALGVEEVVNSPTFVLEKVYALPLTRAFKRLVHIDAYRLESGAELVPLGFAELMNEADTLIILEWPENVAEALARPAYQITLTVLANQARRISYA